MGSRWRSSPPNVRRASRCSPRAWSSRTSAMDPMTPRSCVEPSPIAEVTRPEGSQVLALAVTDAPAQEARPRRAPVWTAPRLRELLLDALATGSGVRLRAELERRSIPLVFMVDAGGSPVMRSWPNAEGAVLPVFADLAWLYRAAEDTQATKQGFGFAAMKPGELRQWAATGFSVAIGVFDDRGSPLLLAARLSEGQTTRCRWRSATRTRARTP
jgi:hypothetical protein